MPASTSVELNIWVTVIEKAFAQSSSTLRQEVKHALWIEKKMFWMDYSSAVLQSAAKASSIWPQELEHVPRAEKDLRQ